MKFNWGTGIFIFIVIFMMACAAFFIFANMQDNTLVESDYYAKGLRYEEVLQKMRNTSGLHESPWVQYKKNCLRIRYPSDLKGVSVQGTVYLYRPSNKKLDIIIPISYDTAMLQLIRSSDLHTGKYMVKLDWTMKGKSYYFEKEIFVE
ncbi:MAG: FixH family protein [Bacteroidetes bacterium]|nr:FixH family protein [Bacteroidota bacterium]